jgi:thioredoxin reductase
MMNRSDTNHVKVAIIGAGPAGIGAAVGLVRRGIHSVILIERKSEIGGIPALYKKKRNSIATFALWTQARFVFGEDYVQKLNKKLLQLNICIWTENQVIQLDAAKKELTLLNPISGLNRMTADAVIMACGAREKTLVERGWIAGARPARIYFTKHIIELIDHNKCLPSKQSAIIGSDLIACAAAAKLKKAGAVEPIMLDRDRKPQSSLLERLYFRRWTKLHYRGSVDSAEIVGSGIPTAVKLEKNKLIECDSIVLSGSLIPNSELALTGNIKVEIPSRIPICDNKYQLSEPGWFATGNILGGFHGAEWCYFNGLRVARSVSEYLSNYKTG